MQCLNTLVYVARMVSCFFIDCDLFAFSVDLIICNLGSDLNKFELMVWKFSKLFILRFGSPEK